MKQGEIDIVHLPGLIDILPNITQNLDCKSLYNLKMTCKQFSNMVREEEIQEKRKEENIEERKKLRSVWLKQPFPYIEAYRSYYSLYLPLPCK